MYRVCESSAWIKDEKTIALLVSEGAYQDYLDAEKIFFPESRKKETLSEIRQYKIDVSDNGWVKAVGSEDRHIFQGQLLYLRRLHYYARYGDYVGSLSHRVRQGAIDHKVEGWEMLSGAQQWTKISERIKYEADEWAKRAKSKKHGSASNHICSYGGLHGHWDKFLHYRCWKFP